MRKTLSIDRMKTVKSQGFPVPFKRRYFSKKKKINVYDKCVLHYDAAKKNGAE